MKRFTSENFRTEVLDADLPVLVEFSAAWCGPCKIMSSVLETLSDEYHGRILMGMLDIADGGDIAMQYGIMNVPTILIFKKGAVVKKLTGLQKQNALKKYLEEILL